MAARGAGRGPGASRRVAARAGAQGRPRSTTSGSRLGLLYCSAARSGVVAPTGGVRYAGGQNECRVPGKLRLPAAYHKMMVAAAVIQDVCRVNGAASLNIALTFAACAVLLGSPSSNNRWSQLLVPGAGQCNNDGYIVPLNDFILPVFVSVFSLCCVLTTFDYWLERSAKLDEWKIGYAERASNNVPINWARVQLAAAGSLFNMCFVYTWPKLFIYWPLAYRMGWCDDDRSLASYADVNTWPLLAARCGGCALMADTWFYWSHRMMHHPSVYRKVHKLHHGAWFTTSATSVIYMYMLYV